MQKLTKVIRNWSAASLLLVCLALTQSACVQAPAAGAGNSLEQAGLSAQDFLIRLAETVNLQTARIDMTAVRRLGVELSSAEAAQPSFIKVNTYPQNQNGIVATSYTRETVQIDQKSGFSERLSVTLQPMLLCIDTAAIYAAWKPYIQAGQFAPISFGAGRLSATDGLHRDQAERDRRGNGPIEMIVNVLEPRALAHQTWFVFNHQYHRCARSVTLTTRYAL
jgi:hypothetical protein